MGEHIITESELLAIEALVERARSRLQEAEWWIDKNEEVVPPVEELVKRLRGDNE